MGLLTRGVCHSRRGRREHRSEMTASDVTPGSDVRAPWGGARGNNRGVCGAKWWFFFVTTLPGWYYRYPHLREEETEAQKS